VSARDIQFIGGWRIGHAAWAIPAIPYRTDAPVSTSTFAVALLVTLCLLALLVAALIFIRRRGWLALPSRVRAPTTQDGIQLQASRRLSIATTAHVLSYQGNSYLVVESSRGANSTITPIGADSVQDGEAS
jgi:hypothetical protein